jgi:hypothetical protein
VLPTDGVTLVEGDELGEVDRDKVLRLKEGFMLVMGGKNNGVKRVCVSAIQDGLESGSRVYTRQLHRLLSSSQVAHVERSRGLRSKWLYKRVRAGQSLHASCEERSRGDVDHRAKTKTSETRGQTDKRRSFGVEFRSATPRIGGKVHASDLVTGLVDQTVKKSKASVSETRGQAPGQVVHPGLAAVAQKQHRLLCSHAWVRDSLKEGRVSGSTSSDKVRNCFLFDSICNKNPV